MDGMLVQLRSTTRVEVMKHTIQHYVAQIGWPATEQFEKRMVIALYSDILIYTNLFGDKDN